MKNPNVMSKFFRARSIPIAVKNKVEAEINHLLLLGLISPVDYSWRATPVIPVFRKNGEVPINGDFKVMVSPEIEVDHHPDPRVDESFCRLHGGI